MPKSNKVDEKKRRFLKRLPWILAGGAAVATLGTLLYNAYKPEEEKLVKLEGLLEKSETVDEIAYAVRRKNGEVLGGKDKIVVYHIRSKGNIYKLIGIDDDNLSEGNHYSIVYLTDKKVTISEILERTIVIPLQNRYRDLDTIQTALNPDKTYRYDGHLLRAIKSQESKAA